MVIRTFSFSPSHLSQILLVTTPLAQTQAASLQNVSWQQTALPFLPGSVFAQHNRFSFLGVQSSDSRGLGGRVAASAVCREAEKGVWESQDVGGSMLLDPFEGERKSSSLGLSWLEQLGCACPLLLPGR